jgi:hypothetical protein
VNLSSRSICLSDGKPRGAFLPGSYLHDQIRQDDEQKSGDAKPRDGILFGPSISLIAPQHLLAAEKMRLNASASPLLRASLSKGASTNQPRPLKGDAELESNVGSPGP